MLPECPWSSFFSGPIFSQIEVAIIVTPKVLSLKRYLLNIYVDVFFLVHIDLLRRHIVQSSLRRLALGLFHRVLKVFEYWCFFWGFFVDGVTETGYGGGPCQVFRAAG